MLFVRHIQQRIATGLLVLLAMMQINAVVFRHAHRLANGQIITHAHPYNIFGDSCPLSPSPHTTHELLLLDAVSNAAFIPTFAILLAFLLLIRFFVRPVFFLLTPRLRPIPLARPTLRGPPFRLLF